LTKKELPRKNIAKLSLFAFLLNAFFACGSGAKSPEDVIKEYLNAIKNENWEASKKLIIESIIIVVRFKHLEGQANSQTAERANYYLDRKIPFDTVFDIQEPHDSIALN